MTLYIFIFIFIIIYIVSVILVRYYIIKYDNEPTVIDLIFNFIPFINTLFMILLYLILLFEYLKNNINTTKIIKRFYNKK